MKSVLFNITTDASGDYSETKAVVASGPHLLYAVEWVDTDFDAGVDATLSVTGTQTGVDKTLLTLSNADAEATHYPRVLGDDDAGADLTGWYVEQLVEGQLKLVVEAGGNVKTGKMVVWLRVPDFRY